MQMKQAEGLKETQEHRDQLDVFSIPRPRGPGTGSTISMHLERSLHTSNWLLAVGEPVAQLSLGCSHPPRGHESIINIFFKFLSLLSGLLALSGGSLLLLVGGGGALGGGLGLRRGPEGLEIEQSETILMRFTVSWVTYQVVPEELHDQGRVLVALLAQGVELCTAVVSSCPVGFVCLYIELTSNGVIKSKFGEVAGLVGGVQDFVVEDREVQGQAEADGVGRGKIGRGDLSGSLVGLQRGIGSALAAVANGELSQVTVVVTLHLVVEDLGLAALSGLDEVLVQNLEDVIADLRQLGLDLLAVLLDQSDLGLVAFGFLLLFNRGDDSPRGTAGTNDVLVGDRQEIPLLNSELNIGRGNNLHVLNHLCVASSTAGPRSQGFWKRTFIALSLLSELGEVDSIFVTHGVGFLDFDKTGQCFGSTE